MHLVARDAATLHTDAVLQSCVETEVYVQTGKDGVVHTQALAWFAAANIPRPSCWTTASAGGAACGARWWQDW